jgi:hypothetical protein
MEKENEKYNYNVFCFTIIVSCNSVISFETTAQPSIHNLLNEIREEIRRDS